MTRPTQVDPLSAREQEIAEAFSGGESYSQIADRLCISPSTVRTHLTTVYRKLGVSSKLELHRHFEEAARAAEVVPDGPAMPDKPSIAVLAFENMSGDPEQEYFSDGITEDIITALSRSSWLFIIARNTTFTYKGKKVDVKRVARELGVRYVLEGSVRRAGDRVRVTAQLIDGLTGGHVWSERYDGQLADVFDLQDEITQNVVASILTKVQLTAGDPVVRRLRPNMTVWELVMQAWQLLYDFDADSYAKAIGFLEQALEIDPDSTEANLLLGVIHYHSVILGFAANRRKTAMLAYDFGRRATRLDDRNEYAQWALGLSCFALGRHDEALSALTRAVDLNPNCSVALGSLGTAFALAGRTEEAIVQNEIAIRSNPLDPSIFFRFSGMGLAHCLSGRYDPAAEWAAKAVHIMPGWYLGHFVLIASHSLAGRSEDARTAVAACRAAIPEVSLSDLDRMELKDAGSAQHLRNALRGAGLRE